MEGPYFLANLQLCAGHHLTIQNTFAQQEMNDKRQKRKEKRQEAQSLILCFVRVIFLS